MPENMPSRSRRRWTLAAEIALALLTLLLILAMWLPGIYEWMQRRP